MNVRRVVTGHNASGKAVIASDQHVAPITLQLVPGAEFHRLWGADTSPSFPDNGAEPSNPNYFPPVGGFRFGIFTVAPETTMIPADIDIAAAFSEMVTTLPGMAAHMEPDNPGMLTTASVDYEFVVSGEVTLELDDGVEVHLRAGDTVVQNGTRHAWRNRSDKPCVLVVVLVGTPHARVTAP